MPISHTVADPTQEETIRFYNHLKKNKIVVVPGKSTMKDAVEVTMPQLNIILDSMKMKDFLKDDSEDHRTHRNIIDLFI